MLLLDLPIAIEPSAWLASSGPQDSIWAQYGPIPMGWNYAALIVALVLGFGALETVLSWTAMAVCSFLKSPSAAPLVVALFYVIASQFESLVTSLGMLLGITSWIKTIGWIVDRLCLVNYRLGASFFQEFAGGAYQGISRSLRMLQRARIRLTTGRVCCRCLRFYRPFRWCCFLSTKEGFTGERDASHTRNCR